MSEMQKASFTCSSCGKKVPSVVLFVNPANSKIECNECQYDLYKKIIAKSCKSEEQETVFVLEIKKGQLEEYIKFLRGMIVQKGDLAKQVLEYWEYKEDDKYTLADKSKKRIELFLNSFSVEKIREAIDIAFAKPNISGDDRVKYFFGILNNWKKEKDISPEEIEIKKYWNYKRPQTWKVADDGKVKYIAERFELTIIKYYIDRLIDDKKGWASFDDLIEALNSKEYE